LRLGLALLCLLGLAGCGGTDRQAAAQQRWQARRVQHYVLSIREFIGSHDCTQVVEIRDEQLVEILGLSCPLASIWTVDWLFRSVAQKQLADDRCALTVPGAGCVCRFVPDVRAEYDPLLGYPRSIVVHQNWAPAWQRPGYWAYLARNWAPPNCTAPSSRPSWELFVRELRPLP
jgi:hypothetical protein